MGSLARGRWIATALLLLAAVLLSAHAAARNVLKFESAQQPVMLQDAGDAWLDESGTAQAADVATNPNLQWHPTGDDNIYKLGRSPTLWIRFTVPPTPNNERWYLEVPYPGVDRVTLYVQNAAGEWTARSAGDNIAIGEWPVPHRHPVMPVSVSPTQPRVHLLRIQNGTIFGAPLQFVSDTYMGRTEQGISLMNCSGAPKIVPFCTRR